MAAASPSSSTGRPGAAIEGEGHVSDVAFGADGARVVAAWPDEMVVRLVETSSGRELWRHEGPLVDVPTLWLFTQPSGMVLGSASASAPTGDGSP